MAFEFTKYHALGNDYIVIDPKHLLSPLTTEQVIIICHRNFGVGSDGILLGPLPSENAKCALRIYNPDGSEAEKSGNGLRIFSSYLWIAKSSAARNSPSKLRAGWCDPRFSTAENPCVLTWARSAFAVTKFP